MEWMQHMLTRKEGSALQVRVCWLEVDKRVKQGTVLTLKGERKRWKVEKQFRELRTSSPPRQDWKVGGLY